MKQACLIHAARWPHPPCPPRCCSFQAGHRVFNGGFPFCAGGIKCWKHGECGYYVYHK